MARLRGYVLVASAAVLWGSASIAVSSALAYGMSFLGMAALMTAVGSSVMVLYAGGEGFRRLRPDLMLFGAVGIALFRAMYAYSVSINGAGVTASLLYTAPLLVAVVAPLTVGEKPSRLDVVLAAVAVVGAYLASNPELKAASALGFLIGTSLAGIYAVTIVAVKYFYSKGYRDKEVMAQAAVSSVPTLAMLTLISNSKVVINAVTLTALLWGGVATIGVATVLYLKGMRDVRALDASVIATLEPVSAIALATVVLGEKYVLLQLLGIALILASALGITVKNYVWVTTAKKLG